MHVGISEFLLDVSLFSKDHSMEPILELFEVVFYITDKSYLRINPIQMKAQKDSLGTSILQKKLKSNEWHDSSAFEVFNVLITDEMSLQVFASNEIIASSLCPIWTHVPTDIYPCLVCHDEHSDNHTSSSQSQHSLEMTFVSDN